MQSFHSAFVSSAGKIDIFQGQHLWTSLPSGSLGHLLYGTTQMPLLGCRLDKQTVRSAVDLCARHRWAATETGWVCQAKRRGLSSTGTFGGEPNKTTQHWWCFTCLYN